MALSKCVNFYPSSLINSKHLLFGLIPSSTYCTNKRVSICWRDISLSRMPVPTSRQMRELGNTKRFLSANGNPGQVKEESGAGGAERSRKPKPESEDSQKTTVSKKSRLKQAVKEYGSTVIVFHVAMSLTSLGFCYLLISSGLDLPAIVQKIGFGESILKSSITQGASTFVIAYAVHKVFAPLRITITLTATPLIVRKLRTMGILKKPAP